VLGLNPQLVYYVSQLWDEVKQQKKKDQPVETQFLHYWERIDTYCKRKLYLKRNKIKETADKWIDLIQYYKYKKVSIGAP
jgi:hypothetical protein